MWASFIFCSLNSMVIRDLLFERKASTETWEILGMIPPNIMCSIHMSRIVTLPTHKPCKVPCFDWPLRNQITDCGLDSFLQENNISFNKYLKTGLAIIKVMIIFQPVSFFSNTILLLWMKDTICTKSISLTYFDAVAIKHFSTPWKTKTKHSLQTEDRVVQGVATAISIKHILCPQLAPCC